MSHDAYTDRLLDLAYGELAPRDAREVEAHVAACEACRAELRRIRETRALMSRLDHEPVPPEGERILLAAARQAAEARRPRRRLPPWAWGAAVAVTALVAVGAVSYRLLALRPGPLLRDDPEALLGGPYAAAEGAGEPPSERREEVSAPSAAAPPAGEPSPPSRKAAPAERGRAATRPPRAADSAGPARGAGETGARRPAPRELPPVGPAAPAAAPPAPAPPPIDHRLGVAPAAPTPESAPAESASPESAPPSAGRHEAFAAPDRSLPSAAREEPRGASRSAAKSAAPAAPDVAAGGDARTTVAVRTFPGCEGETTRRVERDARGRIVRYVREGTVGGRRLVVEHVYRADGSLERATVRDLDRPGAVVDADALGVVLVDRAEDASEDAPPRCGPRDPP